jgi:alkylation response protein AidB-like acyl-CoA dehydrogenase
MEVETRYHPSADQLAVASAIDESLADLLPLSRLHIAYQESAQTWSSLQEIGIFGISLAEEHGGSGLGAAEEALIAIELGRRLASPTVLATMGAAHVPPASVTTITGRRVAAAYRRGDRTLIVEDAEANLLLLRDHNSAAVYELAPGASKTIDNRLWLAGVGEVSIRGNAIARLEDSKLLRLRLIDAGALAGMAAAALDMAVGYAGIREQFGRPIGTFQAVKHHCANMAIAARCARDQITFAAVALDEGREDAPLQVESALFVAGAAALDNAGKNIQIHGGIGFSDEADPHLFLKRAQLQIAIAGGLETANERIASAKAGW